MRLGVSGPRIRELRLAKSLDQHSFAELLRRRGFGTTQATVSRWERGQEPRAYILPVIAETLDVQVADLYSDDDDAEDDSEPFLAPLLRELRLVVRQELARSARLN